MDKDNKYYKFIISGIILLIFYKLLDNFDIVLGFVSRFGEILFPVFLGIIISFFLNKPVYKLQSYFFKSKIKFIKNKSLMISLLLVYLGVLFLIGLFIAFIIPPLKDNVFELVNNLPGYYNKVLEFVKNNEYLSKYDYSKIFVEKATTLLNQILNVENINKYISVITGFANSVLSIFIGIIISIYMILEKENIFSFFKLFGKKMISDKVRKPLYFYLKKGVDLFYKYFYGLALDAFIVAFISVVVLIIFKVKYSMLLGVLIFIGSMIPFFGPIISSVLVYLISMISVGPINALWMLLFQFVLGQIDGNLIQPKVLGDSTGLSPMLVLISVIVFGDVWGPIGMIVGVPICALFKIILMDYLKGGLNNTMATSSNNVPSKNNNKNKKKK